MDEPYRESIYIAAVPSAVFEYFTNPSALACWMGDRAVLDPRPGGQFTLFFDDRAVVGRYLVVDRPSRLVISWGRRGSSKLPPGLSTLEVTFTAEGPGTRVAIAHSGLPREERERHALGWRHYLSRLVIAGGGGTVSPHRTPGELTRGAD
ncbi:MAG TPA: SRPBCC domain-containing protein [Gemmatimonadales bacterium]|nr:SRPBCC domain-containing protein [Gemmatimonadales bacterium]HZH42305.1 SRPBCC domain-containing protein [Gemmatimonadales bacterium]